MTPKKTDNTPELDLFRNKLSNLLDQRHALYKLAALINWQSFEDEFGALYCEDNGSPGKPIRLLVGLEYLKQTYDLSEVFVDRGYRGHNEQTTPVYLSGQRRGISA